jgi:hypothetical protein
MIQETPAGIHAMWLDGAKDTLLIVWNDQSAGRRTVEYKQHDLISANDLMGKTIKSKDGPGGQMRVELDDAVGLLYLLWSKESGGAPNPGPAVPSTPLQPGLNLHQRIPATEM